MSGTFNFAVGVLTLVGFYAIISMILNMEAGWGGLWDLGLAGLLGAGAYMFVLSTIAPQDGNFVFMPHWPLWVGIIVAGLFTMVIALLIGIPALRLRGEYFLITTFAFAEMIRQFIINQTDVTNGSVGFTEIERPFTNIASGTNYEYLLLVLVLVVAGLVYLLMNRIAKSPYGRLLRGCRDNEALALALGKNVTRQRVVVFGFAGLLLGLVSAIYVWHIRAIVPSMYGADITFVAWTALVVGGIGSLRGSVLGAIVLVGFTESLQFIPVSVEYKQLLSAAPQILLGLSLILILRLKPDGLISERRSFKSIGVRAPETLRSRVDSLTGSNLSGRGNAS